MNIAWKGPADMTLHRLDKNELLNQFKWIADNVGPYEKSEVMVLNRFGKRNDIITVKSTDKGIFLCSIDHELRSSFKMIVHVDNKGAAMDFDQLRTEFENASGNDVWLQFPSDDPQVVVGKVLAVKSGTTLMVSLFPCPADIEEVNKEVHERAVERCEKAKDYSNCGECPMLGDCEILKKIDEEVTAERDVNGT